MNLNKYQKAVLAAYGGGDYAWMAELDGEKRLTAEIDTAGDGLFTFLMHELDDEDIDYYTAMQRLRNARDDVLSAMAQVTDSEHGEWKPREEKANG